MDGQGKIGAKARRLSWFGHDRFKRLNNRSYNRRVRIFAIVGLLLLAAPAPISKRLLVVTYAADFRHDSIPRAEAVLAEL